MNEEEIIRRMAVAYRDLLMRINWDDPVMLAGIREGLNKFLSNAWIDMTPGSKYEKGHYYSQAALEKVRARDFSGLVFEHTVPKAKYIQRPCEEAARGGQKSADELLEFIEEKLNLYWKIAVITKDEDDLLPPRDMPSDWDGIDVRARYQKVGISLNSPETGAE